MLGFFLKAHDRTWFFAFAGCIIQPENEGVNDMQLRILGMNGGFPEPGGATSGYLLTDGDTSLILDLGSGTLAELTKAAPMGACG